QSWLDGLRDMRARVAIQRRVDRLANGNFGDHRFCREGGVGAADRYWCGLPYRVYYAQAGEALVLLLCGGGKRSQNDDIERAVEYWKDYQRRLP
ncbi:MAG: type II toxin-antitoxin system RelE/ParE family toxin, partial [Gammaproteobacteria bacterium]